MAIALISFFILPGYVRRFFVFPSTLESTRELIESVLKQPEKPSPLSGWWLKDEHVAICVARNRRIRRAAQRPITLKSFFETFKHWELWAFAIGWAYVSRSPFASRPASSATSGKRPDMSSPFEDSAETPRLAATLTFI